MFKSNKICEIIYLLLMCEHAAVTLSDSAIMTVRQNQEKSLHDLTKKINSTTLSLAETILNEEKLLTNINYKTRQKTNDNNKYNNNNNSDRKSNQRITNLTLPQDVIKIISFGISNVDDNINRNVGFSKNTIKDYDDRNVGIRARREYNGRNEADDDDTATAWANINEEVDTAIPLILSHFEEIGITHFKLPDMQETLSLRVFFITYSSGLSLFNGNIYNIERIQRNNDALMTYRNKAFEAKLNLTIDFVKFDYDFILTLLGNIGATGTVIGTQRDILLYCDIAVDISEGNINLNRIEVVRFGDITLKLDTTQIISELSGIILTPITNLFKEHIRENISKKLKPQLKELIDEFSKSDKLGIKKFIEKLVTSLLKTRAEKTMKT